MFSHLTGQKVQRIVTDPDGSQRVVLGYDGNRSNPSSHKDSGHIVGSGSGHGNMNDTNIPDNRNSEQGDHPQSMSSGSGSILGDGFLGFLLPKNKLSYESQSDIQADLQSAIVGQSNNRATQLQLQPTSSADSTSESDSNSEDDEYQDTQAQAHVHAHAEAQAQDARIKFNAYENIPFDINRGPHGEHIDPKLVCPFCGRKFAQPGSMGRHLDIKKGTLGHPASRVEWLRRDVKRRGDPQEVYERRALKSKEYNSRKEVRERNKSLRKKRDYALNHMKSLFKSMITADLVQPSPPPPNNVPTFAYLVLYLLDSNQWPFYVPEEHSYQLIKAKIEGIMASGELQLPSSINLDSLQMAYHDWLSLSETDKSKQWAQEQLKMNTVLFRNVCLHDLVMLKGVI